MGKVKNKEYYAIASSNRVEKPTIYSSWGDAHPRVTGTPAEYEGFYTIEKARDYMREKGKSEWDEVLKPTALDTTPMQDDLAFYAVAHGSRPGIRECWYGKKETREQVHEISGACHKRFKTKVQAEAFIEDWKEAFAEVWRLEIKRALDRGHKPRNMRISIDGILGERRDDDDVEDLAEHLGNRLELGV